MVRRATIPAEPAEQTLAGRRHASADLYRAARALYGVITKVHQLYPGARHIEMLALICILAKARFEGATCDMTYVAAELQMPRSTLHRHLKLFQELGYIVTERDGRRTLIDATELGYEHGLQLLESLLDHFHPRGPAHG